MRKHSKEKREKTTVAVVLPKKKEVITTSEISPKIHKEVFVDEYSLPAVYNNTKVTLIARDPYWIHAYWEIAPQAMEALRKKFGSELDGAVYTLRMYDVTCINFDGNNAHHWFDIVFYPPTNNWYVSLWHDNVSYCAELGLRTAQGRFHPLSRSNFVTTPAVSPSQRTDVIWMKVEDRAQQAPFIFREMKRHKAWTFTHPAQPWSKQRRKVSLTREDVRAYYSKLFPLLRQGQGRQKQHSGPWRQGKDYPLDTNGGTLTLSKDEIQRLLLGSSESLMSGASEKNAPAGPRKFYFEIGTELIVYGRTEPDAAVWLGDKKIELRPDGTFTLRFALADNGEIPLDFSAVSADKVDKREIKTGVTRSKTIYSNPGA